MSFEVEWLDEQARMINHVNVTHWLIDKQRDIQFWIKGKGWQIRAEGDYSESIMLRIKGQQFRFELLPDANFRHYMDSEIHHYKWEKLLSYTPQDLHGYAYSELVSIIKEALIVQGGGVLDNKDYPNYVVEFNC